MANIAVSVIDANNISLVLTARPPVAVTLDRGVSGVGIASISGTTISGSYYLVVTYTNGTTQNVGPFALTGTVAAGSTTQIQYNSGGALAGSANLTFNGTNLIAGADATINGVKVGKGAGSIATNTAVGVSALAANTTGYQLVAVGQGALAANTTGFQNTAVGKDALGVNTTGIINAAFGAGALQSATTADGNTAVGSGAQLYTTTGAGNTSVGRIALFYNTTGANNVAIGKEALFSNTTASNNTAVGYQAGYSNTTSLDNIFIGFQAGYSTTTGTGRSIAIGMRALFSASTATDNTAIGYYVGNGITTGVANTAVGGGLYGITSSTLQSNSTGSYNSAFGISALASNTTASNNTAVGYQTLYTNTGGNSTAVGYQALKANTTGGSDAFGYQALTANTTGTANNAFGLLALATNTTGSNNTAFGQQSLISNTTASNNTAMGYQAGYGTTTGASNTFLGQTAGFTNSTGVQNVTVGMQAGYGNTTGSSNVFVGFNVASNITLSNNNTAVGYQAMLSAGGSTNSGNSAFGYYALTGITSGTTNTAIGSNSGSAITTGSKNVILGGYTGSAAPISATGSNYVVLSDGDGNVRQTIDGSGNVGIGVTPSAWQTTSYKALQFGFGSVLVGQTDATVTNLGANFYINSSYIYTYKNTEAASRYEQYMGQHKWHTAPSGTAGTAITFTQAMTLDAAGRLGIAVTPSTWASNWKGIEFQVGGSVGSFSTGTMVIGGNTINNGSNNIYKTAAGASLYSQYNGSHAWYSAASGTAGSTISWSIGMQMNTSGVSVDKLFAVTHIAGTGSGIPYINFSYAGTTIGSITQSGTTAVLYNTTSDYRLKNNARALVGSGEFIDALKPTTWEWSEDGRTDSGFLAHEFQTVSPYSVNGEKDAEDEEGNAVYQSMQASSAQVIANLVAEIQDLRKRLAAAGI